MKKFFKASIGNIIEWYDFSLFAFYSVAIGAALFPKSSSVITSVVEVFFVFGIGFLARPIGGFLLGKFGDKYGQYLAVNIAVYGMALCSLLIAFIPQYQHIGMLSIIILVLLRLGQGFCAGGQFSGLLSLVTKTSNSRRSFLANMAYTVSTMGFLLAALTGYLLTIIVPKSMSPELWRIAFVISGLLGVFFHFFGVDKDDLKRMPSKHKIQTKLHSFGLIELITTQYRALIGVTVLSAYSGCMYFFSFSYFYTYLTLNLKFNSATAYHISIAQISIACLLYPVAGAIADRCGKQRMAFFGMILTLIAVTLLIHTTNPWLVLLYSVLLVFAHALIISGVACVSAEVFFPKWRMTGSAISWNIGAGIAGFFPMISASFLSGHSNSALIWLVVFVILFGVIGHGFIRICKGYLQIT
ncbi:MFS transporter [Cysteiniphilum halobium]|uniref:MFS transporter n=1 Tax=Cysteiniphilum halobium TaxID=2219059 RepID=UPI000E6472AB|nr:MFS transporter [Cysteiniphilum halobium]